MMLFQERAADIFLTAAKLTNSSVSVVEGRNSPLSQLLEYHSVSVEHISLHPTYRLKITQVSSCEGYNYRFRHRFRVF